MSYSIHGVPEVVNGLVSILDPAFRQKRIDRPDLDETPGNDFTNTFNACVDHASRNRWNVFVPKGVYLVAYIDLCPHVTIKGVGIESDVRHNGKSPYLFRNPKAQPDNNGLIGGVGIEDLMVRLHEKTETGFMFDQVYDSVIARVNVRAEGCQGEPFRFTGGATGMETGQSFCSIIVNRFEDKAKEKDNSDYKGCVAGTFYSGLPSEQSFLMKRVENEMNQVIDGTPKGESEAGWLSDAELLGKQSIRNVKSIEDTEAIRRIDIISGVGTMSDVETITNVTEIKTIGTIAGVESLEAIEAISHVGSLHLTPLKEKPSAPHSGTLYHLDTPDHPAGLYLFQGGQFQRLDHSGVVVKPEAYPFFRLDGRTLFQDGDCELRLGGWKALVREQGNDDVVRFHGIPAWARLVDGMTIDARKITQLRLRAPKDEAYYQIAVKAYNCDGIQLIDPRETYVSLHGASESETSCWTADARRQNRANVHEANIEVLSPEVFSIRVSILVGTAITALNAITSVTLEVPEATMQEAIAAEALRAAYFTSPTFSGASVAEG